MNAAAAFRDLRKRYGKTVALDGLSLDIPRGSIFGLVGSNGAGKTTLLSIAAGLLRADAGACRLFDEGPFDPGRHAGRLTLLPQDSHLPYYARVRSLLAYYARLQGIPAGSVPAAIRDALRSAHLEDRLDAKVRSLSHGMLRRLTVAQAFLGNPELVLLDEPMSGLDPAEVLHLRRRIREKEEGQTVVVSSHMLSEVENLCDHVAIIEQGRAVRVTDMADFTHRRRRLLYRLETAPPVERLAEALPDVAFEWQEGRALLLVTYPEDRETPAGVNARLVPVLLAEGIGVTEIVRGSSLESEYFIAHARGAR